MAVSLATRIFTRIVAVPLKRPLLVLTVSGGLVAVAAYIASGLGVNTSRFGLVSASNPDQARMLHFYERFGNPDAPVMLVSGGEPAQRQALVDEMTAKLGAEPGLAGRVLARVGPEEVAEVLLLQRPEALADVVKGLPKGLPVADLIEGGLPAWFGALAQQIQAGLDGEAPAQTPEQAAQGLRGLTTVAGTFDRYLAGEDVLAGPMAEAPAVRGRDARGYLTTVDGQHHVITMFPRFAGDAVTDVAPTVHRLEALKAEVMASAPAGLSLKITGLPAFIVDEHRMLQSGMLKSSVASALAIVLLCLVMLRSFRQMLISQVPLIYGVALTLAFVRLAYSNLNLITSSFVAVLLGLGIDFAVHVLYRFNEERRAGAENHAAIEAAVVHVGPAIVLGAVVTGLAFASTLLTEFTAYAELGLITVFGLVFMVMSSLLVLPALLVRRAGRGIADVKQEPPGFGALTVFIRRFRVPLLVLGLAGGVAGGIGLPRIGFNSRYFDFLPASTESAQALDVLEADPLMSPVYANVTAPDIATAQAMAVKLRALPEVGGVQTATDMLPVLDEPRLAALRGGLAALDRVPDFAKLAAQRTTPEALAPKLTAIVDALDEVRFGMEQGGLPTGDVAAAVAGFRGLAQRLTTLDEAGKRRLADVGPKLAGLLGRAVTTGRAVAERGSYAPEDLPLLFRERFVARDGSAVALYVIPSGSAWDGQTGRAFHKAVAAIDPDASGLAININVHETMIVTGFRQAAGLSAVLIFLVVMLQLRGLRDAVLALIPTGLGWLWMLGVMAVIGLNFNVANIVALPLVIGIGTAFGVHLMHRAQGSAAAHGGVARLDDLIRGTGGAVVLSALTTIASFAALMLGDYGGQVLFGLTMVIGISACLLASLFVLPSLLAVLGRAK
jgi:predicted RND superfamily exporter protein